MVKIKENDVVRFGRIPFRVSRVRLSEEKSSKYINDDEPGLIQLPEKVKE